MRRVVGILRLRGWMIRDGRMGDTGWDEIKVSLSLEMMLRVGLDIERCG